MALEFAELNRLISLAGVSWRAKESSISARARARTPIVDGVNLFGLSISPDDLQELKKSADGVQRGFRAVRLPQQIDWRENNGSNWLAPVRDQRPCGACVAFATVATLESRVKVERDDATLDLALSEGHLFFCGIERACSAGWDFVSALKHCEKVGVARAADVLYIPKDQPCTAARAIVRVESWAVSSAKQARRKAIATGGPVIAGMRVFEDFLYYKSGIYRHVGGDFQGLHAVCVVGYDDDRQCWLVRNSWGAEWGEDGYVAIGYGECGIDSEFVFFAPVVEYDPGGFDEAEAVEA